MEEKNKAIQEALRGLLSVARVISNCGVRVAQSTMARYIERLKKGGEV